MLQQLVSLKRKLDSLKHKLDQRIKLHFKESSFVSENQFIFFK